MGDTTWYFLLDDDEPTWNETPEGTVWAVSLPGEPGQLARNDFARRMRKGVYKVSLKLTRNSERARELTEDFLAEKILNPEFYTTYDQEKGSLRKYAITSLYNFFIEWLKKDPRRREVPLEGNDLEDLRAAIDEEVGMGMSLERASEAWGIVRVRLEHDPTALQVTHYWLFERDYAKVTTQEEAAAALGIVYSTFRNALGRGLREMRRQVNLLLQKEVHSNEQSREEMQRMVDDLDTRFYRPQGGAQAEDARE